MRSVSQKFVARTLVFLGQSGKVPKEAPQGTNGSLTSLARLMCRKAGAVFSHANWSVHLSVAKSGIDFPLTTSVAPADSRALFAPANRGAASKAPRFICRRQRFGAFRSAAHPYGGRSTCSYIFEEKRQRLEKQRQCNISTPEVIFFPIRDVRRTDLRAV